MHCECSALLPCVGRRYATGERPTIAARRHGLRRRRVRFDLCRRLLRLYRRRRVHTRASRRHGRRCCAAAVEACAVGPPRATQAWCGGIHRDQVEARALGTRSPSAHSERAVRSYSGRKVGARAPRSEQGRRAHARGMQSARALAEHALGVRALGPWGTCSCHAF